MADSDRPIKVDSRTTAEQVKVILGLNGIKQVRRWQEMQVGLLAKHPQNE